MDWFSFGFRNCLLLSGEVNSTIYLAIEVVFSWGRVLFFRESLRARRHSHWQKPRMRFSAFQSLQLCTWFYSQADCTCLVAAWIFVYEPSLPVALAASCPSMCFWIFGALTCWLLFQTSLEGARASVCQKGTRGRKKKKLLLSKTLVSFSVYRDRRFSDHACFGRPHLI